jgi:acid stress-induced BolA-like protein IbaG/YrbA
MALRLLHSAARLGARASLAPISRANSRRASATPVRAMSGEGQINSELIERMTGKIQTALDAKTVEVQDVQGDGRHVEIVVVADVFSGQSQVNRQRMVYKVRPLACGAGRAGRGARPKPSLRRPHPCAGDMGGTARRGARRGRHGHAHARRGGAVTRSPRRPLPIVCCSCPTSSSSLCQHGIPVCNTSASPRPPDAATSSARLRGRSCARAPYIACSRLAAARPRLRE